MPSDTRKLLVPAELDGIRLDRVLAALFPEHSRSYLRELIDGGFVTAGGEQVLARHPMAAKTEIDIRLEERHRLRPGGDTELPKLTVLFEDEDLLVVDKPAGMATHPSGGVRWGTLSQAAEVHCGAPLPALSGDDRPGVVHRLDKLTSGTIVLAKTESAFVELQRQFKARQVAKEYRAIVFGLPRFHSEWIETEIGRHATQAGRMCIVSEGGRDASTYYEVVERFTDFAYLLCRPRTGRTHQIRVHLTSVGHPVVRDAVYKSRRISGELPKGAPDPGRQCLHAAVLGFRHPVGGQELSFEARLPDDMAELLEWLRQ